MLVLSKILLNKLIAFHLFLSNLDQYILIRYCIGSPVTVATLLKGFQTALKRSHCPCAIPYMFSLSVADSSDRPRIKRAYSSFGFQFVYELRSEAFSETASFPIALTEGDSRPSCG